MQQSTLIVLGVLVLVLIIIWAIFRRAWRSLSLCPHCGSRRVARQTVCPFCHQPYRMAIPPNSQAVSAKQKSPEPNDPPRLVCIEGTEINNEFPLKPTGNTLGRSADNSISIDGILVSRNHAEIFLRDAQYVLRDLGSTNGTYVNGARISERSLQRGDLIQIGKTKLVFQIGAAVAPAQTAAPSPPKPMSTPSVAEIAQGLRSYQITGTIGSGGAATVFKGVSRINHAPVAIKILNSIEPFIREKFKDEGALGLRLKHPHIVQVFQYGEDAGTYFIVMEYVDGGSLRQRLIHGVPSALEFVQLVIGQTCEALAYSHKHNVIHRDIKPENIMLSTQSGVKVVDFGIAKWTSATTKTSEGILVGTPYYIPYEQAVGEIVTPASDIYSLGVVLYEMLTGEWPFTGGPLEVVEKHLNQEPKPPREINPQITPQVETVVMRALEKDIRRRYQNAMDMASDLGYQAGTALNVSQFDGLTTIQPVSGNLGKSIAPRLPSLANIGVSRLVVFGGGGDGKQFPLDQPVVALYRENVDQSDTLMSRGHHCRVIQRSGQFWLEDDNSTNGTFLNGQKIIAPTALRSGDVVQIGNAMLRFVA